MNFQAGGYVFTPNILVLPFASAFFVLLLQRQLQGSRNRNFALALASFAGAVIGALALGFVFATGRAGWQVAPLNTFGFLWGALAGLAVCAAAFRLPLLPALDALLPAVAAACIIARIGCVFSGCCPGTFHPAHLWPLLDMACWTLAWGATMTSPKLPRPPGYRLALFLLVYAAGRFAVEFVRDDALVAGPLTASQLLASAQFLVAAFFVVRGKVKSEMSE
jgi:phosphatidylglycerol:prolipoprotein diacylglycerol transferase